ncbi:MAG: APC family permease [Candidatus Dormibacteraceae bacterium]
MAVNSNASSPAQAAGLRGGAVGLWGDIIAAVTNVAPSTGVATTLGAILAVAGDATPFIVLVAGISMLCIAVAYDRMNLWQPSAAAQAMWVARAIRPVIGLALGLTIMIESVISNVGNATLFGPYFLGLVFPSQASNGFLQAVIATFFVALVTAIAILGIRAAIRFQTYIIWVEFAIMFAFLVFLVHAEYTGMSGSQNWSLSWFLPSAGGSFGGILGGFVIAVFMLGGWESAVYLAEEQEDAHLDPGRAGIITVIFTTIWSLLLVMGIQAIAPVSNLVSNSANVIAYAAGLVMPNWLSFLVSLAVLSSVIGVVQSQLQVFSRIGYRLSLEGLLPKWLARLSAAQTPWIGITIAAVLPVILLIVYLSNGTAASSLALVTGSAGILYIAMYVAGGLACTWYYRRVLFKTGSRLFYAGILPIVGVVILLGALVAGIPNIPSGTLIPAAIFVLIGIPIAWLVRIRTHAAFFDRKVESASE